MKTIGILSVTALLGAGVLATTGASAADIYGYGHGYRTIIHEDDDADVRVRSYGYRSIGHGDVYAAPRYRTRRVIREIYEYEDDDLDD